MPRTPREAQPWSHRVRTRLAVCLLVTVLAGLAPAIEAPADAGLGDVQLRLWQSPEFQKRFAESYLAETDIEPSLTERERDRMMTVLNFLSSDKVDEAARILERETKPASSAVFDFTLANIHFQRDELDQAASGYQRAVGKFPQFRRAWKQLGMIHIQNGKWKDALAALTRVIELGGGNAVTYGLLGFAYLQVDDSLAAESAYRLAILLDPLNLDWKKGLAQSLYKQERYPEVAALCDRLIAEYPNNAQFWLLQANAYVGLRQPLKAAVNYELVDRLGQSTAASLNMLGDIYVNQELFDMAVTSYVRALEEDPNSSPDRVMRAAAVLTSHGALTETKRLIENVEALRGDVLSDSERKALLKLRARIAVAEGAGEEEAKVLEEIVALDPLDGEALILLGQHRARAEDFQKAAFYFERAASLERYEADAKVRHAQMLVQQGKYDEALPLLRRAQDLEPRDDVQKYLEQVERVAKSR
jgi:tetratricopeptide (TPR) repeat protein